uniref:Uncharacterized protein n=1 Tax=Corethron hystrix TaxID=216773 RepID=A0A7S1G1R7_9STRA|mmetsp:Transcript_7215/g.15647  ORF Transcript_7215/g.15647 Transcript_7215/m.15647 type:complete len:240 (+) Transcript_7215:115-834(+)
MMLKLCGSRALLLLPAAFSASIGGSIERSGSIVSIDFDVPRRGPLCVSVDETDSLEFVWEEWHNLHSMPDEESYAACDFSEATLLAKAAPNPAGHVVTTNGESAMFFSCSKICSRNGHKVRVCVGGYGEEENACSVAKECAADRRIDLRRRIEGFESGGTNSSGFSRRYAQVANDTILNGVIGNIIGILDPPEVTNDEMLKNLATTTSGSTSIFNTKTAKISSIKIVLIPVLILTLHVI